VDFPPDSSMMPLSSFGPDIRQNTFHKDDCFFPGLSESHLAPKATCRDCCAKEHPAPFAEYPIPLIRREFDPDQGAFLESF
jgi:hypothetical protein